MRRLWAKLRARFHPFDNHGACSGVCTVCQGIAPDHLKVKLEDGRVIRIIRQFPKAG